MNEAYYNGLSNALCAAIDTGNAEEVSSVLADAANYHDSGYITESQFNDLNTDARVAGYDF